MQGLKAVMSATCNSLSKSLFSRHDSVEADEEERKKIVGIAAGVLKENKGLAPDEIEAMVTERFFGTDEEGLVEILTNPKRRNEFERIAYAVHDLVNPRELSELENTDLPLLMENFVDAYGSLEDFAPTEEYIAASGMAKPGKGLPSLRRFNSSCDIDVHYRGGKPVIVLYDEGSFDPVELLDYGMKMDECNSYFDALEREVLSENMKPKDLKKALENIEERRRFGLDYLNKMEKRERKFLEKMAEEGKFPFAFIDGSSVYTWGDRKKNVRRISSMIRAVRNSASFYALDGSLPATEPVPEYGLILALEKIKEDIRSGRAMEFNPDYLSSALTSRLYEITPESVKPDKTPLWLKVAAGGSIILAGTLGLYGLFHYLTSQNNGSKPTPSPSPTPSHSPSPTPTPTPSPSTSPTPTPTPTPTPPLSTPTPTPSASPMPTPTPTPTPDPYQSVLQPLIDVNATLANIVKNQVLGDGNVKDKVSLLREVVPIYLGQNVQRMAQIYAINNATNYFGTRTALSGEIDNVTLTSALDILGQNDGINTDFDNARKHANMFRLAKYVSNILKYPKDWREGVIQVDDMVYKTCKVNSTDEADAWANAVQPAIKYIVDKLDSGEAKYDLVIPDNFLDAQVRRQRMLPLELFTINITSGEHSWASPSVAIAKYNVSPNPNLGGKSPQQWLEDMAKADIAGNTPRYQHAMRRYGIVTYPSEDWPESYASFQNSLDLMMVEDPTALFIIGYPFTLTSRNMGVFEPVIPMGEQISRYFSTILARAFGRAAFVVTDVYPPIGAPGAHSEPYVVISPELYSKLSQRGETLLPYMFGGWPYKTALKADHNNQSLGIRTYNPRIKRANGIEEEIKL